MKIVTKYFRFTSLLMLVLLLSSCSNDPLELYPTNGTSNEVQYSSVEGYKQSMVTVYSSLSYDYLFRHYFNVQEVSTDEAVCTWDDPAGVYALNVINWTADNYSLGELYSMLMYDITLCNNFIVEALPEKVSSRGFAGSEAETIATYVAEVRFLRAYFYWMMMDLYGNPPFATETTLAAGLKPEQIQRADLFEYLETELLAIENQLLAPKTNEYGRADQAACWSLLARMYLNAEVYTGNQYYSEAITFSKKVIDEAYSLEQNYNWLMLGDNYLNTNEFVFTANYDNGNLITWGGTNYIALGAAGVPATVNGMSGSWNCLRFPESFPELFPSYDTLIDRRAAFWTSTQSFEVEVLGDYSQGYSSFKYRNLDRSGNSISQNNTYNNISDIDFPIFRLAEMYLIYTESVLRGGTGGDLATGLNLINKLRGRAYANDPSSTDGNITAGDLNLDFILDERGRELYWEAFRRTDLIRYDKFTSGNYIWAWKGGVKEGVGVDSKYNLFPLPTFDVLANTNLKQNKDY